MVVGQHLRELSTVLCVIDVLSLGPKDWHILCIELHRQVVRNLTTGRYDDTVRLFQVDDIHHTLECQLIEVETVAHIVVGRYGLRVIVDHHRAPTLLTDGIQCLHTTPVELNGRTDAVSTRTEYDDRTVVVLEIDVTLHACVSNIEVVGLSWILSSQGINLLYYRQDAIVLAEATDDETRLGHIAHLLFQTYGTSYLEIGETIYLRTAEQLLVKGIDIALLHLLIDVDDVLQFLQEPLVDLGQVVNLIYGIALVHCLGYHEDTLICRLLQGSIDVLNLQLLVFYEAVHALANHTKTLLDSLLKVATDGHHLADRLHGRTQLLVNTTELTQVPTWNLTNHVVEGWLEESRCSLGNRVLQLEQAITHTELCCNESQRITCSLRSQS